MTEVDASIGAFHGSDAGQEELALVLKAADHLANVRTCVVYKHWRLLEMYLGEQPTFRAAAYRPDLCETL